MTRNKTTQTNITHSSIHFLTITHVSIAILIGQHE